MKFYAKSINKYFFTFLVFLFIAVSSSYCEQDRFFREYQRLERLKALRERMKDLRKERVETVEKIASLKERQEAIAKESKLNSLDKDSVERDLLVRDLSNLHEYKEIEKQIEDLKESKLKKEIDIEIESKAHPEYSSITDLKKKSLESIDREIGKLNEILDKKNIISDACKNRNLNKEIEELGSELNKIEGQLLPPGVGDVFARGIVGAGNWDMLEGLNCGDSILKGAGYGFGLRAAIALEKPIGKKFDKYAENFVEIVLGEFELFVTFVYRFIFHGSCKPFSSQEIVQWNKLINGDFGEICKIMTRASQNDLRSKDEIKREYESELSDEETFSLWTDLVEDLAATCQNLVEEISKRKEYYPKNPDGYSIVNCADRLCNKLLKVQKWLLRVKSLKDFVNTPEAKSIVPAMKASLDFYFNNLSSLIEPEFNKKDSASNGYSNSYMNKNNRYTDSFDDDFTTRPIIG